MATARRARAISGAAPSRLLLPGLVVVAELGDLRLDVSGDFSDLVGLRGRLLQFGGMKQGQINAWTDDANRETDVIAALEGPMAASQAALAGRTTWAASNTARTPRQGTKQEAVLALLRREGGATIAQITDATAWQSHTVRGFLAGLKKKGMHVEVLERIRQIGPNKEGAKGSDSVYRIAG